MIINFTELNLKLQNKIDWDTFIFYLEEFAQRSDKSLTIETFQKVINKKTLQSEKNTVKNIVEQYKITTTASFKRWRGKIPPHIICYSEIDYSFDHILCNIAHINLQNESELIRAIKIIEKLKVFL